MSRWSSHHFRQAADGRLSEESTRAAIRAAHKSQDRGLPAILTLNHLARHVGLEYRYLREIVERQRDPYRWFRSRKHSGGYRIISVPESDLMHLQRWIARFVLNQCSPHAASFAYQPKRSLVDCATVHVGARWLIKIDVRQFFESISEIQVFRVFKKFDYGDLVSFEMARLTTRPLSKGSLRFRQAQWRVVQPNRFRIHWYRNESMGHLPQGAPTSPMLSNLAMFKFDTDVLGIAERFGLSYSRYSDDLIFSTSEDLLTRKSAIELIRAIYRRMNSEGLRPHQSKTVISPPGSRKIVLGLLVDGDRPRLRREFRNMLECHVHFVGRYGPSGHAHARGFDSVLGFRRYLDGLLSYAAYVDLDFANRLRDELRDVEWPA